MEREQADNMNAVLELARRTLDQGLYFGSEHITRATDTEIEAFAKALTKDMRAVLRDIAYPKRGSAEETMTLQQFADRIQATWTTDALSD